MSISCREAQAECHLIGSSIFLTVPPKILATVFGLCSFPCERPFHSGSGLLNRYVEGLSIQPLFLVM